jgi:hypothetical protein
MSKQRILVDANVIIDFHHHSIWNQATQNCHVAVTPIIRREAKFYRDDKGQKISIDLDLEISSKKIEEIPVSIQVFSRLHTTLNRTFLAGIDQGEREAIAFLNASPRERYLFCTADLLAIKCLGVLGLRNQGISVEGLLTMLKIKANLPPRYLQSHSKKVFERMLNEGFQEAHLHKEPVTCH